MHHLFTGPPSPAGFPRLPCSLAALGRSGAICRCQPTDGQVCVLLERKQDKHDSLGGVLKTQESRCLKILPHDILGCTFVLWVKRAGSASAEPSLAPVLPDTFHPGLFSTPRGPVPVLLCLPGGLVPTDVHKGGYHLSYNLSWAKPHPQTPRFPEVGSKGISSTLMATVKCFMGQN